MSAEPTVEAVNRLILESVASTRDAMKWIVDNHAISIAGSNPEEYIKGEIELLLVRLLRVGCKIN